jgi:hypothetical protein
MAQESAKITEMMERSGIDPHRSQEILDLCNDRNYTAPEPVKPQEIPGIDGTTVLDRNGLEHFHIPDEQYRSRLQDVAPEIIADRYGTVDSAGTRTLTRDELATIGVLLYPYLSYGVLNGGSASSYVDRTKNESFDPDLFALYRSTFDTIAPLCEGQPKGITPAFIRPDGSLGPSFLELKFRMLLLEEERYYTVARREGVRTPGGLDPVRPFFQMTSGTTTEPLQEAYARYRTSPLLRGFPQAPALLQPLSAEQPRIAAMTHRGDGRPLRFFTHNVGGITQPLGFPGGHGQNFLVLREIYQSLWNGGKRFVYLGNVDNLGFTVDPVSLALVALSGSDGGFDFAFRTPVDVKGGILVRDQAGRLNCADIGPAISQNELLQYEQAGAKILFNCATGLFNLTTLTENNDAIIRQLPLRISDQEKDIGRYSQAEQVTWEVIALLEAPLILGIDKYQRFLAAKMLVETLLTSGLYRDKAQKLQPTIDQLHSGLTHVLATSYRLPDIFSR